MHIVTVAAKRKQHFCSVCYLYMLTKQLRGTHFFPGFIDIHFSDGSVAYCGGGNNGTSNFKLTFRDREQGQVDLKCRNSLEG